MNDLLIVVVGMLVFVVFAIVVIYHFHVKDVNMRDELEREAGELRGIMRRDTAIGDLKKRVDALEDDYV